MSNSPYEVTTAVDADDGLRYDAQDIARGSAMLANLLATLDLPAGSRVMCHVDVSVEALMLALAVLRGGHVLWPVEPGVDDGAAARLIADATPAVVVCRHRDFQWLSRLAFTAGVGRVFTLDADRSGSLLERAAVHGDAQVPVAVDAAADAVVLQAGDGRRAWSHAEVVDALHALPATADLATLRATLARHATVS